MPTTIVDAMFGGTASTAGAAVCWYNAALPREQVDPRLLPAAQRRGCTQSGSPPPWAAPPPTCSARARADGRAAGTSSTGHSNPRYATGGNATAHRTPTAGAVRAESACGNPPAPLA